MIPNCLAFIKYQKISYGVRFCPFYSINTIFCELNNKFKTQQKNLKSKKILTNNIHGSIMRKKNK